MDADAQSVFRVRLFEAIGINYLAMNNEEFENAKDKHCYGDLREVIAAAIVNTYNNAGNLPPRAIGRLVNEALTIMRMNFDMAAIYEKPLNCLNYELVKSIIYIISYMIEPFPIF